MKKILAIMMTAAVLLTGCAVSDSPAEYSSTSQAPETMTVAAGETTQAEEETTAAAEQTSKRAATTTTAAKQATTAAKAAPEKKVSKDWTGDDKDGVAAYLEAYDRLPENYMTKKEARKHGWEGGALHLVVPGKCIGGDHFGNFEGRLPEDNNYQECDIDTLKSNSRGAKRIIFSNEDNDLDIWYTGDHYEHFTLIYGDGE